MFGSRRNRDESEVTCIACGDEIARSGAREYDKHGDRWNRADKEFEYLCKGCHRDLCHQPRPDLESSLVESRAGETDRDTFLAQYHEVVSDDASDGPEYGR